MSIFKKFLPLFIVIVLSFWAIKPLLNPGFFPMHDNTQVARVFEMAKSLKDGMFPVRWSKDLGFGYGYPIFNFYAPLAYYFGGFLVLIGFNALISAKIMMAAGVLLAGIFMYLLAREFWEEIGGIVAGLFYVYAPYHALDIYVRGDVAEFYAYGFIPLMVLGFYKIFRNSISNSEGRIQNSELKSKTKKDIWKWVIIGSIGYAGVILSHNLTAMMVTPFLLTAVLLYSYISFRKNKLSAIRYPLYAIFLGLLLSAFYWLPALWEMKYTNVLSQIGGGANFRDNFVCINQLWTSSWGYGGSIPGCVDGLSFMIGKLHILISVFSVLLAALIFYGKKHEGQTGKLTLIVLFFLGFIVSTILTLSVSKPLWDAIFLMAFFQYPWRFLVMVSFFASLLAGSSVWLISQIYQLELKKYFTVLSAALLVFVLLFFNIKFFVPQSYINKPSSYYTNKHRLNWETSKLSSEYMPKGFLKPETPNQVPNQRIIFNTKTTSISIIANKTQKIEAVVKAKKPTRIIASLAYFPAWNVFIDNKKSSFAVLSNGIEAHLPKGEHALSIKFAQTPIEKLANVISLAGISLGFIGIIFSRKSLFHE